ncbi:estradiol 17-beta-dehydrogenase 8-like isoform X2 [Hydractinia symbiolongicarpus]|uniref:estradiol 17-beta-dehydrogenase 8-like isoform X2 n=1 Tax=Hydractinia symbiolongicarpus TaxID=13093 RepID=UPI0025518EED|nr:estradiol 17-beta-dehydrogenase 8-like isoform X2 [Hydractinia symbiolongicarpus]
MAGALAGRIALVTGAASGIGKSVCQLFAKEGATVIGAGLGDVSQTAKELPSMHGQEHLGIEMNVAVEADVGNMMKDIMKVYDRPPCIAVNCAGITRDAFILKLTEKDFDDVLDVNLKGTFFVTKHLCSLLIKNKISPASIINISSIVGKVGNIGQANYTSSKAGVVALTKTSAMEFARYGIRCNAVIPGFIETAMTEKVPQSVQDGVKSMIPLGDFGQPEASEQSRYITAAGLEVTGGLGA